MSTSSGWLMAKATVRANESAGMADVRIELAGCARRCRGSVTLSGNSVATAPGEMTVVRML